MNDPLSLYQCNLSVALLNCLLFNFSVVFKKCNSGVLFLLSRVALSDASERTLQKRFLMTYSGTLSWSHQKIHSKINEDLPKEWITSYSIHDYQFENIVTFRKLPWMIQWRKIIQKQPPRGILRKRCSGNMQQVYRRTLMSKCDFSQVTLQLLKIFFGMVILL